MICRYCNEEIDLKLGPQYYKQISCYNHKDSIFIDYNLPFLIRVWYENMYVITCLNNGYSAIKNQFVYTGKDIVQLDNYYLVNNSLDETINKIKTFMAFK
jgi:hypothetical protein